MCAARNKLVKDCQGRTVHEGDVLHFTYGIPLVSVEAKVVSHRGRLRGLCPGHNPPEFWVDQLEEHVGPFWLERK